MEKRNVVEEQRTPTPEFTRSDDDWDKAAAADFHPTAAMKKVSEQQVSESVQAPGKV